MATGPSFRAYKLEASSQTRSTALLSRVFPRAVALLIRGNELTATTAAAVPTKPEAVGGMSTSITLRWRPVAGSGLRYAVYGSAALGFAKVYSGDASTCTVSGLDHGKEYGFGGGAMNAHGGASDFSAELMVRCGAIMGGGGGREAGLLKPELLKLTHDSLSMRWDSPPGGASTYIVELAEAEDGQDPDEDEWSTIYEGAPPGREISFLAEETEYRLRVALGTPPAASRGLAPSSSSTHLRSRPRHHR